MKTRFARVLGPLVAATVLFGSLGCEKNEPMRGDTAGPSEAAATQAGVPGNTFTVASKNGAYPAGLEFKDVKAAVASYGLGGVDKSNLSIMLANTDLAGVNLNAPKLTAGQGIVKLRLSRPGQQALTAGTYKPSGQFDADMRAGADIVVPNGTTVQLNDHKTEGTIEVTELTADSVSGTYDLKDPWSHVAGTFKAKIAK